MLPPSRVSILTDPEGPVPRKYRSSEKTYVRRTTAVRIGSPPSKDLPTPNPSLKGGETDWAGSLPLGREVSRPSAPSPLGKLLALPPSPLGEGRGGVSTLPERGGAQD